MNKDPKGREDCSLGRNRGRFAEDRGGTLQVLSPFLSVFTLGSRGRNPQDILPSSRETQETLSNTEESKSFLKKAM